MEQPGQGHVGSRRQSWDLNSLCLVPEGLPRWLSGKESAYNAGDSGLIPGSGRSPEKFQKCQPTPVFLPGEPWTAEPGGI